MKQPSLYERLGGYDGIVAITNDMLPRLQRDSQLGRFWENRGTDGLAREKQLLIDYLCAAAGGSTHYTGRDMKVAHNGMGISENDWSRFVGHAAATLEFLNIPQQECEEFSAISMGLENDIVEL